MKLWYELGADGHTPQPAKDQDFGPGQVGRRVADDWVGEVRVSTVFLSFDHNHWDHGPPILFETMIVGGEDDQYQERYSTWDEAVAGHARALALVWRSKGAR